MTKLYTLIKKLLLLFMLPVIILVPRISLGQGNDHTISYFPYVESFEYVYGKWIQDESDDFDWSLNVGMTPTDDTGPLTAYEGDCYIYIKSFQNYPAKKASLTSPEFSIDGLSEPVLAFAYNMNGRDMGMFEVLVSVDGGKTWKERICYFSGNKGNTWYVASLDLRRFAGKKVVFRFSGTSGSGPQSDLALDYMYVGEQSDFRFNDERNRLSKPFDVKVSSAGQRLQVQIPSEFVHRSSLELINLLGSRVYSNTQCGSELMDVDVSGMDKGLYFIRIYHQGEVLTRKVYINN